MNRKILASLPLGLALAVGACVDEPTLGEEAQPLPGGGVGSGDREQGRYLLGGDDGSVRVGPDELIGAVFNTYFLSVGTLGTPTVGGAVAVEVENPASSGPCLKATIGSVVHRCVDPIFTGMTFVGPSSGQPRLRIAEVVAFTIPGPGGHAATGYRLEHNEAWASGGAPAWEPYCSGDRLAYPLAGRIARSRATFDPSAGTMTFACSEFDSTGSRPVGLVNRTGNGVVAKAMSWGFLPGSSGVRWDGTAVAGANLHRGAVSAGRADYCADGVSHTLDATSIRIFDRVDLNLAENAPAVEPSPGTDTLDPTQYSLESIWHEVIGDKVPRWAPVCLSRLRWQSLPIGPHCASGVSLADPRIDPDGRYCEELDTIGLLLAGAAIDVYSQWNDLGLWRWKNGASGDQITTSLGRFTGDLHTSTLPMGGYDGATPVLEGVTLTPVGKQVFEASHGAGPTSPGGALVLLQSCRKPATGDWVTGRPAWLTANGFVDACRPEGYVWSATAPPAVTVTDDLGWSLVDLWIWTKAGEYTTAVDRPAHGYSAVALVGKLIAPAPL